MLAVEKCFLLFVTFANFAFCIENFGRSRTEENFIANDFPIIGIFTQPSNDSHPACGGECEYIAASYVKFVESAGARVVPVSYYANKSHLDYLFDSLNGFLFPGGESSFPLSAQYIFDRTVQANDVGDFSLLWGTCLGFEWLLCAAARNASILDPIEGTLNVSLSLRLTPAASASRLLSRASPRLLRELTSPRVAFNQHRLGLFSDTLRRTPALAAMFAPLSTSDDAEGRAFVSTMEAWNYPIYATQWHPEKSLFECAPPRAPRGAACCAEAAPRFAALRGVRSFARSLACARAHRVRWPWTVGGGAPTRLSPRQRRPAAPALCPRGL